MIDPRSLSMIWPSMIWLQALVVVALFIYAVWVRAQRLRMNQYSGMRPASESGNGVAVWWQRHGSAMIMLIALSSLLFAVTRPRAMLLMPTAIETVILAIDSSGSMRASDMKPSRIEAAQAAARSFVEGMPSRLRVGIVSVAGTAAVAQAPTTEREDLFTAIDSLQLQRGSAIGSGILISLAELLPGAGIDVQKILDEASSGQSRAAPAVSPLRAPPGGGAREQPPRPAAADSPREPPVEPGSNRSAAIVLLTDGQGNTGPDPFAMAELAARHGVRIFAIGVGTPEGVTLNAQGMAMRVRLDEDALKKIADISLGEYFKAGSASELQRIYRALSAKLTLERRQTTEVTAVFAGVGALLAALAALSSLLVRGRVV